MTFIKNRSESFSISARACLRRWCGAFWRIKSACNFAKCPRARACDASGSEPNAFGLFIAGRVLCFDASLSRSVLLLSGKSPRARKTEILWNSLNLHRNFIANNQKLLLHKSATSSGQVWVVN